MVRWPACTITAKIAECTNMYEHCQCHTQTELSHTFPQEFVSCCCKLLRKFHYCWCVFNYRYC